MDEVPLLFLLLLLSGFFSGAEIALFSVGAEKIQALKNNTDSDKTLQRIARLELLKANPSRLLVTILLGNNVVNIGASALATVIATDFAATSGYSASTGMVLGTVTGVMTFLILLFGEIAPKSLAHKHAVSFSLFVAPLLNILQFILYPLVAPLGKLINTFNSDEEQKHGLSEDELKAAVELSEKEGAIDSAEKELVEKVLEFNEHSVESIMTPRSKVFALEDDTPVKAAINLYKESRFSRIPIFHEKLDQTVGILTVHALAERSTSKGFSNLKVANLRLLKPFKIPITMKIDTLLREFQREKTHLALVYDEHGGIVGLITMEDVMEEIFGEIKDEQDEDRTAIRRTGKFSFECSADIELEQIEDFLVQELKTKAPKKFPWNLEDENKTLGYLILEQLERFPEEGEKVIIKNRRATFTLVVKKIENEKIGRVSMVVK